MHVNTVKEHYDKHLGHFYSWMSGDFESKTKEFIEFLTNNSIKPVASKTAIDLGAGHGLQSIPLALLGYKVFSIDFNQELLDELTVNAKNLDITVINDDIRNFVLIPDIKPELIVCCGDTLAHFDNKSDLKKFIIDIANNLDKNGKVILSFRDYSKELHGVERFIPVKNDNERILTCILDYELEFLTVTDLLHEKTNDGWVQKVSSYKKIRIITTEIIEILLKCNLTIVFNQIVNRLTTIIASK